MTAPSSALPPSPTAGDPNAIQVFQNALVGQPANDGSVAGSQIDDTMTAPDMRDPANDDYPLAIQGLLGSGVYAQPYADALSQQNLDSAPSQPDADPSVGDGMTTPDMSDPATGDYPLAIQGLLGSGVYAHPYTDALSQQSLDSAPSQPEADPSVGDTMMAPDMRDPATDDYPLAIQGLLGSGVYAQPYADALSQQSLNTAPSQPDPSSSVGDATTAPDMSDPATGDYPLAIQGLLGSGVSAQPYTDALSQQSLDTAPPPPEPYVVRPGDTVSGIAHGDYAKIAAIYAANDLKLAADGSPILHPGHLLLIPDISGLGPAAHRRQVSFGRNKVATNTRTIAQRHTPQTTAPVVAPNAYLGLMGPSGPPLSTPENTWGAPNFSSGRLFTAPVGGDPWASRDPRADLRPQPPGQGYGIGNHGQGYFLSEGPNGSEIKPDTREDIYWQQKAAELGKAEGYGADGQPGMGAFASIFYSYPKYVFHLPDDVANCWGSLGSALDDVGAGFSGISPYAPETPGGLASYETPYESPSLKTDITYPDQPPAHTIYAPEAAEAESPATQLGGAYKDVQGKIPGYHAHHMPAKSISPLSEREGPSIAMIGVDHELTASFRNSAAANAYRQLQADLIRQGDFRAAQEMDIQDIRKKFGSKYDDAIQQMLKYSQDQGHW